MKFLLLLIFLISMISCSSPTAFTYKNPQSQIDYELQHNEADKNFSELDKETKSSSKSDNKRTIDNETLKIKNEQKTILYHEKKRPTETVDKSRPTECKSGINKPCWILNPDCVQGYTLLAVGSAKEQADSVYAKRKSATLQARGELSRMITLYIENELKITESYDRKLNKDNYERYIETQSRQRSSSYLNNITEVDCYNGNDTEFFILLGIK